MRKIVLFVALALLCSIGSQAQEARIFQVEHADVEALAHMLNVFAAKVDYNSDLRTISVNASPETLAAIEETIARFDVPPPPQKNIVLTFHMLMASKEAGAGESLPSELEDVAAQLKSMFGYEGLRLMDTGVLRVRDREGGNVNGAAEYPGTAADQPAIYGLRVNEVMISSVGETTVVRLNGFRLGFRVPYSVDTVTDSGVSQRTWQLRPVDIETDIDVREGQKVVVGKASLDAQGNHLILVVTAEVAD